MLKRTVLSCGATFAALLVLLAPAVLRAQSSTTNLSEDFTGTTTTNSWFYFNGACLTASSATGGSNPGQQVGTDSSSNPTYYLPGCTTLPYYNETLVGGQKGYLGATASPATPDAVGQGALRFTNGHPGGYHQNGAIVAATPYPTGQGLQVTFKTVTYLGDSGGYAKDGADGISFYLLDGCMPITGGTVPAGCGLNPIYGSNTFPAIGAWGGSLAYTCSNANPPYDGLVGGYLGLGIDEYGNFLNGTSLTNGETDYIKNSNGTPYNSGDNTASGGYYRPGRIGLRGAGSVAWGALTTAYGTNPGSTSSPYYPASLATTCSNGGTYNATSNSCGPVCPTGYSYNPKLNTCDSCPTGTTFYPSGGSGGAGSCNSCPSPGVYNVSTNTCSGIANCGGGGTYQASTNTCVSPAGYCASGQTYVGSTVTCHYCTVGVYDASSDSCFTCSGGGTYSGGTCSPAGTCSVGTYYATGNTCNSCATGTYNLSSNTCTPAGTCSSGTYVSSSNTCNSCAGGATYSASSNSCSPSSYCPSGTLFSGSCYSCASGSVDTSTSTPRCDNICPSGYTYVAGTNQAYPKYCFKCPTGDTLTGPASGTNAMSCSPTGTLSITSLTAATKGSTSPTLLKNSATANTPSAIASTPDTPVSNSPTVIAATPYPPTPITPTAVAPTTTGIIAGVPWSLVATQKTCSTGHLWNYSNVSSPTDAGTATLPTDPKTPNAANTAGILDYPALPGAYSSLPSSPQLANESAATRSAGTPIFYNLKITQNGLLTLAYSQGGGAYTNVINNLDITKSNGPVPSSFRFAFAGSTGGSTNIHEIMCFKAAPDVESASSVGLNEKQSARIETGTQAFFATFNPVDATGRVAAYGIGQDASGNVTIASVANWDASCNLTGVAVGKTCVTTLATGLIAPQSPTASDANGRQILTWNGSTGVPFEWTGGISTAQQTALGSSDLLSYLRGVRTEEIDHLGSGTFRTRDAVLGDIIDSSPTWVGPPGTGYVAAFKDRLYSTDPLPENSATTSFLTFQQNHLSRENVVYVGSNDGMLHGFRTMAANGSGSNDGLEVLAYMPAAVLNTINNANASLNFTSPSYNHNYFVDATPGFGDVFYGGTWHTWLAGGLGSGGAAVYILDITDPGNFAESNAASLVIGEWTAGNDSTAGTISCLGNGQTNNANCGINLGNVTDMPQMRRLHNGTWGVIFGNGVGSSTGDAGIYVMSINASTGAKTWYYLSTGSGTLAAPGNDGIAASASADLDGDRIIDYVYAGDLNGNLWRFDLTSNDPTKWAAGSAPLFKTSSGQPITSAPVVGGGVTKPDGLNRVMVSFGTGRKTPMTSTSPATYLTTAQNMYGVWDWNLAAFNTASGTNFATLPSGSVAAPSGAITASATTMLTIPVTVNANGNHDVNSTPQICFAGTSDCASGNTQYGWSVTLPESNAMGNEQIVFDPVLLDGVVIVDSTVPANNQPTTCTTDLDQGWTYAINILSGLPIPNVFPQQYHDTSSSGSSGSGTTDATTGLGFHLNATGSPSYVTTATGASLIYETSGGKGGSTPIKLPKGNTAKRLTWIQLR